MTEASGGRTKKTNRTADISYDWFDTDLDLTGALEPENNVGSPTPKAGAEEEGTEIKEELEKEMGEEGAGLNLEDIRTLGVANASTVLINWLGKLPHRIGEAYTILQSNGIYNTKYRKKDIGVTIRFEKGTTMRTAEDGIAGNDLRSDITLSDLRQGSRTISFPTIMRKRDNTPVQLGALGGKRGVSVSLYYFKAWLFNLDAALLGVISGITLRNFSKPVGFGSAIPTKAFEDKLIEGDDEAPTGGNNNPDTGNNNNPDTGDDDNPDTGDDNAETSVIEAGLRRKRDLLWLPGQSKGQVVTNTDNQPQVIYYEQVGSQLYELGDLDNW
jgi:hypothetical protein